MISHAFKAMYPDKYEGRYDFEIKYSAKFKGYNANVKYTGNKYTFNLSSQWRKVGKDIQIGLIQSLFNKIFKTKVSTINIDLYNLFLKNIHLAIPKDNVDSNLKISYDRMNDQYFNGMLTMPNLTWGTYSTRKFGSYDFGTDTISISKALADEPDVLDYVMYHEMLHKKLQFETKKSKSIYHSPEFKRREKEFENFQEMEQRLQSIASSNKKRKKKGRIFSFLDYFD